MKMRASLSFLCLLSFFVFELSAQVRWQKVTDFDGHINTDVSALCRVADSTVSYLKLGKAYDSEVNTIGTIKGMAVDLKRVKETLNYVCELAAKGEQTLSDPAFIRRHFELYKFRPDLESARQLANKKSLYRHVSESHLVMTKYYVRRGKGSETPTSAQPYALYGLPFDEAELSIEMAQTKRALLTRFQYTKQKVLQGLLSTHRLAPPLVWLSREDMEAALMQGTIVVEVAGALRTFNVHRSNEIPYDKKIKPYQQQRYWYFKEVEAVLGYGKDAEHKIHIEPYVTFAGDLKQLGLGKLLMVNFAEGEEASELRLGILADTGGAFNDNLFQLDYLTGYYASYAEYHNKNKHLPDAVQVYMLLKKPS